MIHRLVYSVLSVLQFSLIPFVHGVYSNVTYLATSSPALLSSPGYPNAYADNLTYEVLITAGQNEVVNLDIVDCSIEYVDAKIPFCQLDELTIYDGHFDNGTILYQGCCLSAFPQLQSSGSHIFIRFISDTTVTSKGFRMRYYNNVTSTVHSNTDGISSATLTYIAIGMATAVCIVVVLIVIFVIMKVKLRATKHHKINPHEGISGSTDTSNESSDNTKSQTNPPSKTSPKMPASLVLKPSPWSPKVQQNHKENGPNILDLHLNNKSLPDGNSRGNRLPPVKFGVQFSRE